MDKIPITLLINRNLCGEWGIKSGGKFKAKCQRSFAFVGAMLLLSIGKDSLERFDVFCSLLSCSGLHKQLCDLDVTILVGRHESSVVLFVLLIYPYLVFE